MGAQGVERMGKENERNRSEDEEEILVVLRLKMCISKQGETLSVSPYRKPSEFDGGDERNGTDF